VANALSPLQQGDLVTKKVASLKAVVARALAAQVRRVPVLAAPVRQEALAAVMATHAVAVLRAEVQSVAMIAALTVAQSAQVTRVRTTATAHACPTPLFTPNATRLTARKWHLKNSQLKPMANRSPA
jgi:hypothetical protein